MIAIVSRTSNGEYSDTPPCEGVNYFTVTHPIFPNTGPRKAWYIAVDTMDELMVFIRRFDGEKDVRGVIIGFDELPEYIQAAERVGFPKPDFYLEIYDHYRE